MPHTDSDGDSREFAASIEPRGLSLQQSSTRVAYLFETKGTKMNDLRPLP
jgi:hypothetical protein